MDLSASVLQRMTPDLVTNPLGFLSGRAFLQMRKTDLNYFSDNRRQNAEPVQELENEVPCLKLEEVYLGLYTMLPRR